MKGKFKVLLDLARQQIVTTVLVGLICLLSATFVFREGSMSDLQVALEERSNLMRKLTTTVKNAAELEKHTEKLREVVDAITVSALTDGELAANQRLFLRLEADSGVKIIDLRPQGVVPAGAGSSFVFMNFSLSVSGDYRQIMLFLKKLEHGSTLSRIINTTLSSNEQSGESAILSVDLLGVKK